MLAVAATGWPAFRGRIRAGRARRPATSLRCSTVAGTGDFARPVSRIGILVLPAGRVRIVALPAGLACVITLPRGRIGILALAASLIGVRTGPVAGMGVATSAADRVGVLADPVPRMSILCRPGGRIDTPASRIDTPADRIDTPASRIGTPASRIGTPADRIGTPADRIGGLAGPVAGMSVTTSPAARIDTVALPVTRIRIALCLRWRLLVITTRSCLALASPALLRLLASGGCRPRAGNLRRALGLRRAYPAQVLKPLEVVVVIAARRGRACCPVPLMVRRVTAWAASRSVPALYIAALLKRTRRMLAVLAALALLRPGLIRLDIGPPQIMLLLRHSGVHETRYP